MEEPRKAPRYVVQLFGSLIVALLLVLAAGGVATAALSATCGGY